MHGAFTVLEKKRLLNVKCARRASVKWLSGLI